MEDRRDVESRRRRRTLLLYAKPEDSRLSLPFVLRFLTAFAVSFTSGAILGLAHGSRTSGLRFRAENSHRFPTTPTGWYLYHKSKNYHIALGGLKEGFRLGSKIALWTGAFFFFEEAVDDIRGSKDFLSTMVAGLGIAGLFSAFRECCLPFGDSSDLRPRPFTC